MSSEDIRKILNTFKDIEADKKPLTEHRSLLRRGHHPLNEIQIPEMKIPNFFKGKKSESKFDEELFRFAQTLSLPSDADVNERHDYYRDGNQLVATVDCFVNNPKYTEPKNGIQLHGDALEQYMQIEFPGTRRIKEDSKDVTDDYNVNDEYDDDVDLPRRAIFRHTFTCPSKGDQYG